MIPSHKNLAELWIKKKSPYQYYLVNGNNPRKYFFLKIIYQQSHSNRALTVTQELSLFLLRIVGGLKGLIKRVGGGQDKTNLSHHINFEVVKLHFSM